ncbi:MAG: hypothetical protein WC505_04980 [Patescibacteria group bacterium]
MLDEFERNGRVYKPGDMLLFEESNGPGFANSLWLSRITSIEDRGSGLVVADLGVGGEYCLTGHFCIAHNYAEHETWRCGASHCCPLYVTIVDDNFKWGVSPEQLEYGMLIVYRAAEDYWPTPIRIGKIQRYDHPHELSYRTHGEIEFSLLNTDRILRYLPEEEHKWQLWLSGRDVFPRKEIQLALLHKKENSAPKNK